MILDNYLRKYFILDSQNCSSAPEVVLEEALQAGVSAFQFREKGTGALEGAEKIALGKRLRALCREYQVPFFINDDVDLIEELEVDGVHVGQNGVGPDVLRIRYPDLLIGISVSTEEEVQRSPIHLVDYVGACPIFPTGTKGEAAERAVGVEWIRWLREQNPFLPIVGIGGITCENAKEVLEAGANGVAVMTKIVKADDVTRAVTNL